MRSCRRLFFFRGLLLFPVPSKSGHRTRLVTPSGSHQPMVAACGDNLEFRILNTQLNRVELHDGGCAILISGLCQFSRPS